MKALEIAAFILLYPSASVDCAFSDLNDQKSICWYASSETDALPNINNAKVHEVRGKDRLGSWLAGCLPFSSGLRCHQKRITDTTKTLIYCFFFQLYTDSTGNVLKDFIVYPSSTFSCLFSTVDNNEKRSDGQIEKKKRKEEVMSSELLMIYRKGRNRLLFSIG